MNLKRLIEQLQKECDHLCYTVEVLKRYEKSPTRNHPTVRGMRNLHWTQKPENAAKLKQTVRRMTDARLKQMKKAKGER